MADISQPEPPLLSQPSDVVSSQERNVRNLPVDSGLKTLIVRHLPEAVPAETLSSLFSYHGAVAVRPFSHGRMRNCAFLDFKSEVLAFQALRNLNGLKFIGKTLSIETAHKSYDDSQRKIDDKREINNNSVKGSVEKGRDVDASDDSSRSGRRFSAEPIAPRLGVDYPFPPHLEYAYPPPDFHILTNITNALIAVPRFYTQVLHLMNKMNIPAPFRMALSRPPLPPPETIQPLTTPPSKDQTVIDSSCSESESELSDEEMNEKAPSHIRSTSGKSKRKRAKKEAIVGPGVDKDVALEDVGLKPATLVPKEIPVIKKKNPVLQIKIAPKAMHTVQNDVNTTLELNKPSEEKLEEACAPFATPDEIQSKRLGPEEILSLPKFKNYTVGEPSSILYIKNLDKNVVIEDLYYIFGSLFGSLDAAKAGLSVKLMQEGRMRGQAFVTFPTVDHAHRALNLVNGFVLKGKPVIIQFGRNPSVSQSKNTL